ncbi:MAG: metallophosphoesterase [Anaerovoracaceae bacterium]|jgi:predicted MPP superfamily phosphohydrolase
MKFIKRLIIFLFLITLLLGGILLYSFQLAPRLVALEEVTIQDREVIKPMTIVLIADTHFSQHYSPRDFQKAVDKINSQDPDLVIFLGDLFDDFESYTGDTAAIPQALAGINAKKGKYAVYGNHDYGGSMEFKYKDIMKAGGFTVLVNESVHFPDSNVTLTGVDDYLLGYGDAKVVEKNPVEAYNVVACHEPDIVDEIMSEPVDLMVSGHTHGGQIRIPFHKHSYLPPLGKKYSSGLFNFDNPAKTTLYVNRGLGTTKIPARLFSTPEVTVIRITPPSH